MDRREFLMKAAKTGMTAGLAASPLSKLAAAPKADAKPGRFYKALLLNMLPGDLSVTDKFKLARDVGFDGIEVPYNAAEGYADQINQAVEESGILAHSVLAGGWQKPFSHPDDKVADEGVKELEAAFRFAKAIGADGVLVVPAVVNKEVRYIDAWQRSQKRLKRVVPLAKELGVRMNIEEVWNKFLLSPLEFAQYVDDFKSPWVRAYFDVANVIDFGWPEDWIRTLGKRIAKVHVKDFKRDGRQWVGLGEGDADFPAVMKALAEVGVAGWLTCELPGGDEAYLREVGKRVNRIIHGQPIVV